MKRNFVSFMLACALCSNAFAGEKIIVGATPVPHAEILEAIKGELAKKGFDLEIKEFYHQIRQAFDPDGIMSPGVKQGATLTNFVRHLREAPLIGFIEY